MTDAQMGVARFIWRMGQKTFLTSEGTQGEGQLDCKQKQRGRRSWGKVASWCNLTSSLFPNREPFRGTGGHAFS